MIEGRGIIKNIENARKKIEKIGGIFKDQYSFTDIIFVFKSSKTKLNKELIRLRIYKINNWPTKDVILIHKTTSWKGNSKTDNIILRKEFNTAEEAINFINKNFKNKPKKDFEYFREGWEYDFDRKKVFVEDIKGFKPTVEIEAENEEELNNVFKKINVIKRLSDSVPEIMRKIIIPTQHQEC